MKYINLSELGNINEILKEKKVPRNKEKVLVDKNRQKDIYYHHENPLYFKTENTEAVITFRKYDYENRNVTIEYSLNKKLWKTWNWETTSLSLNKNSIVYLRGDNDTINDNGYNYINSSGDNGYFEFNIETGKVYSGGNLNSLIGYKEDVPAYCFAGLFYECTALVTPPELPSMKLSRSCYQDMFYGCTSLKKSPELPALDFSLCYNCYNSMFEGCTSLVDGPSILPATTLEEGCYYYMFQDCTSLIIPPRFPRGVKLHINALRYMFRNCTSLIKTPDLSGFTGLKDIIYSSGTFEGIFYGCTSLKFAKVFNDIYVNNNFFEIPVSHLKQLEISKYDSSNGNIIRLNEFLSFYNMNNLTIDTAIVDVSLEFPTEEEYKGGRNHINNLYFYDPSTKKFYLEDKTTEITEIEANYREIYPWENIYSYFNVTAKSIKKNIITLTKTIIEPSEYNVTGEIKLYINGVETEWTDEVPINETTTIKIEYTSNFNGTISTLEKTFNDIPYEEINCIYSKNYKEQGIINLGYCPKATDITYVSGNITSHNSRYIIGILTKYRLLWTYNDLNKTISVVSQANDTPSPQDAFVFNKSDLPKHINAVIDKRGCKVNGVLTQTESKRTSAYTYPLFVFNTSTVDSTNGGFKKYSSNVCATFELERLKITNQEGVLIMDLFPVKLLRDLKEGEYDSNTLSGIKAGSYGLIDKVSGKFFGCFCESDTNLILGK